jgi:hypothetical protein
MVWRLVLTLQALKSFMPGRIYAQAQVLSTLTAIFFFAARALQAR